MSIPPARPPPLIYNNFSKRTLGSPRGFIGPKRKMWLSSCVFQRLGGVGIRRFRPRGGHQNNPFRGYDYMFPDMVGKLTPYSIYFTRGLVKYVPGRGYFRAVPSQNGDRGVTSPPPPQSLNDSAVRLSACPVQTQRRPEPRICFSRTPAAREAVPSPTSYDCTRRQQV